MVKNTVETEEETEIIENGEPSNKKLKKFSVKEFRANLKEVEVTYALQQFHELCFAQEKSYDYILEYLEKGGSCLELLQLMEVHTEACHLILEIVYFILLEINSKYPQYISNAHSACRYFINTYMTMTNKMLSLNSTRVERIAILKFLTAAITLSPNFAKDILININFSPTNLGFLTNTAYSKDSVRNAFVHFLISFLIDGYYPTISALLDKRGLLTCIVKGLVHDSVDIVCVVLNAMKAHILENPSVSKTVKMRTFSTPVIKDIVRLYSWKGQTLPPKAKKEKAQLATIVQVSEEEKSKVNSCVHEFLLILCTSKFGIIFRDQQVGLGRKSQNILLYTVLESLDSPWKHPYASELVVKICSACPDLTKTIWINMKSSLEPRSTEQWLRAMNFASTLLKELDPVCIEYCIKDLTPHQLAQITQMLVAPTQILKTLTPEESFNDKYLKHHILKVLVESLKSVELYLNTAKRLNTKENFITYNNLIKEHLNRNFPNSSILLSNYKAKNELVDNYDYLDVIINILTIYQRICPELVDFTESSVNFKSLLSHAKKMGHEHPGSLEMKLVRLYLNQEPGAFLPKSETFEHIMPIILDCYCKLKDDASYEILEKIFINTGIFESSQSEIRIWITSLTYLDVCTDSIANLFVNVLKLAFENSATYFSELASIKSKLVDNSDSVNVKEIIEQLCNDEAVKNFKISTIKHIYLSPYILGLLEYLPNIDKDKVIKSYLQFAFLNLFHLQTDLNLFLNILQKYNAEFLSKNLLNYCKSWDNHDSDKKLNSNKGKMEVFSQFSNIILTGDILTFLNEHNLTFKHDISNFLNVALFYVTNFAKKDILTELLLKNCIEYIKFCVDKSIDVNVLKHPLLLTYFSPLEVKNQKSNHRILVTNFILDVIKISKCSDDVLDEYREKLHNSLKKMFQKCSKYKNLDSNSIINIINILGLNPDQSCSILNLLDEFDVEYSLNDQNSLSIFVNIITSLLNSLNNLNYNYQKFFNKNIIESMSNILSFVLSKNDNLDFSIYVKSFTIYLETFPHYLGFVHNDLFKNIVQKEEYNKECTDLSILLLKSKRNDLLDIVMENIEKIVSKKGAILPILEILAEGNLAEDKLLIIFNKIEYIIVKALEKPQKAGQHFEKHYKAIGVLIDKFMDLEKCKPFVKKIHKFESAEIFHVHLLKIIFTKVIEKEKKYINNSILILIHLSMNIFKKQAKTKDWIKSNPIFDTIKEFLDSLNDIEDSISQILENETFKTFWKFCLKFGLSGNSNLLALLRVLVGKFKFEHDNSELMMEMILTHSEFLDLILNEDSDCKTEILHIVYELFKGSPKLMMRHHVPILLSAYRATIRRSDRIILAILRMFEASATQTQFYDFNPFLWGKSAANHYSVRSDVQKSLWRQPRTGTVLDILEEPLVLYTVKKHPLKLDLRNTDFDIDLSEEAYNIYDLSFLIPLFSSLLSPENAIQTYRFTKSGALSLTITALSSNDKEMRAAACFTLFRFYHHVEARLNGKDNQLWLRFIEAIFKGISLIKEMKLNKFSAIFLARMAIVLTQPTHPLYVPLSQYLSAKSVLNFSSIPELYTLLHSPDVNYKDHRNFILNVLRDGLVSSNDFHVALRSVAFKLIMDQYSSAVTDTEGKIKILQVIERVTKLDEGTEYLCESYGLLSWLCQIVINIDVSETLQLRIIFHILYNIVTCKEKIDFVLLNMVLSRISARISKYCLIGDDLLILMKIFCIVYSTNIKNCRRSNFCSSNNIKELILILNNKECKYISEYGSKYITFNLDNLILNCSDIEYYQKYLILSYAKMMDVCK